MKTTRILAKALLALALAPAALLAQGGDQGGGGLYDMNTGLSAWTLIVFIALVAVLGRFAWGPILDAVDQREKRIRSQLEEAAKANEEAQRLLEEHRKQLAEARRQANDLIAEGRAAGEALRKEIEEKARAEAQAILERAQAEIERERDQALEDIRREAVDLALAVSARLLQERLDAERDRQLIERYLSELSEGAQA